MFSTMVKKTLDLQVVPNLAYIAIVFAKIIFWKFKGIVDISNALVIKNLNESLTPPYACYCGCI
jgi:hypothetical protein